MQIPTRVTFFFLAGAMMAPLALYISVRHNALPKPFTVHFPGGWFFILVLVPSVWKFDYSIRREKSGRSTQLDAKDRPAAFR